MGRVAGAPLMRGRSRGVVCGVVVIVSVLCLWSREVGAPVQQDDLALSVAPAIVSSTIVPSQPAPVSTTGEVSDPVLVLRQYFSTHGDALAAGAFSFPVGGQVHLSDNHHATVVAPPLCGTALLHALEVSIAVRRREWVSCGEGQLCYEVQLATEGRVYNSVVLAGRLVTRAFIASGVTHKVSPRELTVVFGPFSTGQSDADDFSVDVIATWVGPFFLGQRWHLPDRNDDPPFSVKREKCLALTLAGNCDRFGVVILRKEHEPWPTFPSQSSRHVEALCSSDADISGNGLWTRVAVSSKLDAHLLDDPVGLNRHNGSAWRWSPAACAVRLFSKDDAMRCFASQEIRNIGLFGDSMMVEFVRQLSSLLEAPIRQGKFKRLRFMELQVPQEAGKSLRIRFSRSYTTREGNSVIATPSTILSQLLGIHPDVILGNFAVLHWQQNMRTQSAWEENLKALRLLLTPPDRSRSWQQRGGAYYLGPTLIHMGRTQGLEPTRTAAFAAAAQRILASCANGSSTNCERFRMFQPMNLSSSRREGAYDGQHWACYHTFGGISQMTTQLWLNQLCNT